MRAIAGPGLIIGASANTLIEAAAAENAGADYIGAGALFSTATKKNTRPLSLDVFSQICATVSIPVVGIGGIRESHVGQVIRSGGCGIAASSMILFSENLEETVKNSARNISRLI